MDVSEAFAGVARWAAKLAAGFVLAGVMAVAAADDAEAMADSDGYVPVVYSCWAGNEVGLYSWYFDGYTVTGTIYINSCLLDSMGAGPGDYQAVIDHEMGHALGYGHSHDPYSAMYPVVAITGGRRKFSTIRKIRRLPEAGE